MGTYWGQPIQKRTSFN